MKLNHWVPMVQRVAKGRTAIFTAGNKHTAQLNHTGFSLLELLVVLAIISFLVALVLPRITLDFKDGSERVAMHIVASMQRARSHAIRYQLPVQFLIDVDKRIYRVGMDESRYHFPEDAHVVLSTARSLLSGKNIGSIQFYPDGSSSGGKITIGSSTNTHQISINWLTGGIQLSSNHIAGDY